MKHFLHETDFTPREIGEVFALARDFKRRRGQRRGAGVLAGQTWALIFSKSSTRTRVSFEVGIHELGGNPLFLNRNDIQLGRGETIEDTAQVLSRYVHGLVVRTFDHHDVERLAAAGTVPVINALTDFLHPCQIYADAFTLAEHWSAGAGKHVGGRRAAGRKAAAPAKGAGVGANLLSTLRGRKIAFVGDTACNVANSWVVGANLFGMEIALAGPKQFAPGDRLNAMLEEQLPKGSYDFTTDAIEAVRDADVVYTDTWISMGKEEETLARRKRLAPYTVTSELLAAARPDAVFMHCLPAHAGEEVTQEVLDSPRSIIFDQAENRLHMQKAIMATLAIAAEPGKK